MLDEGNRRQELLAAAARLFKVQGFAATTVRDIAAAAGMRSGSPFYHFENKEALLAAVMQQGMLAGLRQQHAALAALPEQADARQKLRTLVRVHFEVILGPRSDFIPVMLYEWRSLDEVHRQSVNNLRRQYEAAWLPVLQALHAQGDLCGDPHLMRMMIFGALNWSVRWYREPACGLDPGTRKGRPRMGIDSITDQALLLFLREPAARRRRRTQEAA